MPPEGEDLPLFAQGHSGRLQVGILHGLHLRAAQEVVECVQGIRGPGDGLLADMASWTDSDPHRAQALHVVHGP